MGEYKKDVYTQLISRLTKIHREALKARKMCDSLQAADVTLCEYHLDSIIQNTNMITRVLRYTLKAEPELIKQVIE